jgi:hypothetical protein
MEGCRNRVSCRSLFKKFSPCTQLWYPVNRKLCGFQSPSEMFWRIGKFLAGTGIQSSSLYPNHYTNYGIQTLKTYSHHMKKLKEYLSHSDITKKDCFIL